MTRIATPRPRNATTAARWAAVRLSGECRLGPPVPLRRLLAVAILGLVGLAAVAGPAPAQAAAYDRFYANFAGEELMRAINADRHALGLAAYAPDATLVAIARDRPTTCPSNPGLTIRGRARDMADRGYFSHTIAGCSASDGTSFDAFDLLAREGYATVPRGEDISTNNFPSSETSYALGCSLGGTGCQGSTTLPWTVEVAERGFMSSSGHRDNLLSTGFDRFGCGAWRSSTGNNLYACYFTKGGNGTIDRSGPAIGGLTAAGATYRSGTSATLSASFSDAASLLADGYVSLDGRHLRSWAWDHAASDGISVSTGSLSLGTHRVTWLVRDGSSNVRSTSFSFSVTASGGGTTPGPTPHPGATPSPTATPLLRSSPAPPRPAGQGSPPPASPPGGASPSPGVHASSQPPAPTGAAGGPAAASQADSSPTPSPTAAPIEPIVAGAAGDPTGGVLGWLSLAAVVYVAGALAIGRWTSRRPGSIDGGSGVPTAPEPPP